MTLLQTLTARDGLFSGREPDRLAEAEAIADAMSTTADERNEPASMQRRIYSFAALSVAAILAALAVGYMLRPTGGDPRLKQLMHDASELRGAVATLTNKLRTVETEGVATAEAVDGLDKRLKTQSSGADAIRETLGKLVAESRWSRREGAGVNLPALFGVAVLQLRDRIEAGLAFDFELVNLRLIAGRDPVQLPDLERLAPMAAAGVPSAEQLDAGMRALVLVDGQSTGPALVNASLGVLSRVFGPRFPAPSVSANPPILMRASSSLAAGDLAGMVRELTSLSGATARGARPLIAAAERRANALGALQDLMNSAHASLQAEMKTPANLPAMRP